MSAVLKDYWLMWRMALSSRHRHANVIILALSGLGALFAGMLVQLKSGDPLLSLGMAMRVGLGGAVGAWVLYFVPGAVKLNTPANARLVPRLRRRLIGLTAAVWVVIVTLATLMSLQTRLTPAFVFLAIGTWVAAYGLGQSGHRAGQWGQFGAWMFIAFNDHLPPRLLELLASGTGLAIATLLMLAFAAFALQAMFMDGGERHYAARQAQRQQTERLTAAGQFREHNPRKLNTLVYRRILRRDCQARDSGRLLGHLLGAMTHWSTRAVVLGLLLVVVAAALVLLRMFAGAELQDMIKTIGWTFSLPLLLGAMFDSERRNVRLKDTAAEQALVRLAPPMPSGAPAFNRKLASTLLRAALLEWAMLSGVVLCLGAMTGASAENLYVQACLCCLTLPLVAANLRDHARHAGLLGWRLLVGFALSLAVSLAAGLVAKQAMGLPLSAGAALASMAIALVLVAGGFRRAARSAYAFPAGRLA